MNLIDFETKHFPVLRSWLSSERDVVQWGGPELTYPITDYQLEQMIIDGTTAPPKRLSWMAVNPTQALVEPYPICSGLEKWHCKDWTRHGRANNAWARTS